MAAMGHFNERPVVHTWSYNSKKPLDMSQIKETLTLGMTGRAFEITARITPRGKNPQHQARPMKYRPPT
jgi:hypothetical protein